MAAQKSYEDGLRDGQIKALEETQADHSSRLDSHSARLRQMERITWLIIGGLVVLQALPTVAKILGTLSGAD